MGFILQLQRAGQLAFTQFLRPPVVDIGNQLAADFRRLRFAMRALEPDEGGVGIAVDNVIALGFNQRFGLAHDRVAAHGDRRRQPWIEKAAGAGPQHAVKGVHDDLQRLRQRLIMLTLGFIAAVPDLPDDAGQAVLFAREAGAEKSFGAVAVIGLRQPFNQADQID